MSHNGNAIDTDTSKGFTLIIRGADCSADTLTFTNDLEDFELNIEYMGSGDTMLLAPDMVSSVVRDPGLMRNPACPVHCWASTTDANDLVTIIVDVDDGQFVAYASSPALHGFTATYTVTCESKFSLAEPGRRVQ